MKTAISVFVFIILLVGVIGSMVFGSFFIYSYFAPKYEGVRRDVMIESRAYTEASIQSLYRLKIQYESADSADAKATIAAAARHQFQTFDQNRLPNDLVIWFNSL